MQEVKDQKPEPEEITAADLKQLLHMLYTFLHNDDKKLRWNFQEYVVQNSKPYGTNRVLKEDPYIKDYNEAWVSGRNDEALVKSFPMHPTDYAERHIPGATLMNSFIKKDPKLSDEFTKYLEDWINTEKKREAQWKISLFNKILNNYLGIKNEN